MLSFAGCVKAGKHDLNAADGGKITQFRMSGEQVVDVSGYAENLIQSDNVSTLDGGIRDTEVQDATNAAYSNRREYNFKLCGLYDIRVKQTMVGQKLKIYSELPIESESEEPGLVTIKGDNCVYWRVSLPYDHFAPSINLQVQFVFLTVGGAKSYIAKKVLLNPWDAQRGGNPEFLDYTRSGLSENLRSLPAASGVKEILAALEGKFIITKKKLEVGSLQIFPVDKQYLEANSVGAAIAADTDEAKKAAEEKRKNEALRAQIQKEHMLGGKDEAANQAYESFKSLDLHLNIRLNNLKVRLHNNVGTNYDEELKTGRYRIYAQLVATDVNSKGHYLITDKMIISDEKSWTTSTMGVNAVLPISVVIRPQWGNLNLILKVVPTDIAGIEPFEAIYSLGRFNEIAGGKSPLFSLSDFSLDAENNISFNYDNYVTAAVNHTEWLAGHAGQLESRQCVIKRRGRVVKLPKCDDSESTLEPGFRRFQFTPLNVLFSRVMAGDTSTDRTIQYTVETCVIDNLTGGRPGGGLVFNIETEDRGVKFRIQRKTNELGCLNWVGMISHKVYHRENLVNKVSSLTYADTRGVNRIYNLDYYINPWDEKFTFGRDSRILPIEYINQVKAQQAIAPPTRLLMTDFRYDATGFRYVIDKYMNMTVKKTVLMTIHPKILKYNSIVWGRSGSSEVRDGIYLMKIAMQKDYLDPTAKGQVVRGNEEPMGPDGTENSIQEKQFLVVKEMLVRVLGGLIITPVEFDVTDLRTLRIRSQMLIQLETIDEMLLRAVVLANGKFTDLIGAPGTSKTQEILDTQAQEDEINRQLQLAKDQADTVELRLAIAKLNTDKAALQQRLESLLSSMDPEAAKALLANMERIRLLGEQGVSVDRNLKYTELNNILASLRKRLDRQQTKDTATVARNYAETAATECAKMKQSLETQNRGEEAKLYDPNDGALCFKKIPQDEMFYHLVSSPDVETDVILKSLFTKEEFDLYKGGGLTDDFTNAYVPDYDFSLLSNEGDELKSANPDFTSGLPRRTFIGPVTFVLNGNGSALRPTDVLDEASCQGTCEQLAENENEIINNSEPVQDVVKSFGLPVNSAYEESPYFGSIKHFYKKQVNDLIAMERGLRYQYHQEMIAFSKVGNLLERSALNYVSFSGKAPSLKILDYACYAKWKSDIEETYTKWRDNTDLSYKVSPIPNECFKDSRRGRDLREFMSSLNTPSDDDNSVTDPSMLNGYNLPQVSLASMKEFSKNGLLSSKLDLDTKANILHRLCYQMSMNMAPKNREAYRRVIIARTRTEMSMDLFNIVMTLADAESECHKKVSMFYNDVRAAGTLSPSQLRDLIAYKSQNLPMIIERKVRVLETSNQYIYKDGKTINYSVGTGFSLSNSFNVNRGYKIDPVEAAEKTIGLLGVVGKGVSSIIGALGGLLNFQWGVGESQATSNGTNVSEGTTIAGQISTLDIELKKWEKCVIVRFDDKTLLENVSKLQRIGSGGYDGNKDIQSLGTMLCSGDEDTVDDMNPTQPLRVRERYYYFTQIFNEGDMQDPGALFNHPWMLQMRGVRDFTQFHKALTVTEKQLDWGSAWGRFTSDAAYLFEGAIAQVTNGGVGTHEVGLTSMQVVNPNDSQKALDMMATAYSKSLPTFPSMYTYGDSSADEVTAWPVKKAPAQ
jgi:hypothetical protein